MSAVRDYYSGPYRFNDTENIYVHLHSRNIGRAMGGQPTSASEIINAFNWRKQQALQASKNQFKTLFLNSLNQNGADLLQEAFSNDDIMTQLQKTIGDKLQEALAIDKMVKLMQLERIVATDQFAEKILRESNKSIQAFNFLLKTLAEAYKLIDSDAGARFATVLSHNGAKRATVAKGQFLLKAMRKFQRDNNNILLTPLQIEQGKQIVETINVLGNALKTGETKGGDSITRGSIRRMIETIFNTGFAESISAIIKETAYVKLGQTFKASLTGSKQVEIQYSDQFGNLTNRSTQRAAYGKADATFDNITIILDGNNTYDGLQVKLNIGISDKFYKRNFFPNLPKSDEKRSYTTHSYSSGAGGSLSEALQATFGANLRYLYYTYNVLGHSNESDWGMAKIALNEIILIRQIIRLFSARGGNQDFAQFMFVNGQIVPVWDIIMTTMNDISAFSLDSLINFKDGLNDLTQVANNSQITTAQRVYKVNKKINTAKISIHIDMSNLVKIQR